MKIKYLLNGFDRKSEERVTRHDVTMFGKEMLQKITNINIDDLPIDHRLRPC